MNEDAKPPAGFAGGRGIAPPSDKPDEAKVCEGDYLVGVTTYTVDSQGRRVCLGTTFVSPSKNPRRIRGL